MARIAIIGDGAMATVCAGLLCRPGRSVTLWSAFPAQAAEMARSRRNEKFLPGVELPADLEITDDAAGALNGAELAVSAVPAQFCRAVWLRLREHVRPGLKLCSVTKGIENGTLHRPTQILADVLAGGLTGDWPMAALSGPCIAHEVARKLPTTVVSASTDEALAREIQQLFTTPYFRVYTNTDLAGVELAGATKNVIAIAAGILDGMKIGDNAKAALLTRGLVEITRLGVALGGRRETFAGLAGLGDLVTTCVSPYGRNRTFGQAVGQGRSVQEALAAVTGVVEGVATTASVIELSRRHKVDMPITGAVHAVLFERRPPRQAVAELMSRPPKSEQE